MEQIKVYRDEVGNYILVLFEDIYPLRGIVIPEDLVTTPEEDAKFIKQDEAPIRMSLIDTTVSALYDEAHKPIAIFDKDNYLELGFDEYTSDNTEE